MIDDTQNPMTPAEVASKLMGASFRTIKQIEDTAMIKKMNKRDEISLKQAELAAKREYEL